MFSADEEAWGQEAPGFVPIVVNSLARPLMKSVVRKWGGEGMCNAHELFCMELHSSWFERDGMCPAMAGGETLETFGFHAT